MGSMRGPRMVRTRVVGYDASIVLFWRHLVCADMCCSCSGYVDGIDDPSMGWARYAQTIRIFVLNSGLFYIQPSNRTVSNVSNI